jgi:uncharacterized protein YbjT (DUF2867 family)
MRIAIVGGTGTLGRPLAEVLSAAGHDVRALSRSAPDWPVDLRTGAGLDVALEGCDVIVDAANGTPAKAAEVLVEGGRRLLAAARAAGVGHHVCASIVGCDRVPIPYYRVKVAQEEAVMAGGVAWTIVRATQFHGLVAGLFAQTRRAGVLPTGGARLQPIDVRDVAAAIADVATAGPRHARVTVGGPEDLDLTTLARTYKAVTGTRALRVHLPLPSRWGRPLRDGALTADRPDRRGTTTFAEWLS